MTQRPRAFRLTPTDTADRQAAPRLAEFEVTEEPFDAIEAADGALVPMAEPRRGPPWLGMFLTALGGLAMLAVGLGVESLMSGLFEIAPWLGWLALALAVLAVLALLGLVTREVAGIWREQRIERLRASAVDALAVRDHQAAKRVVADLVALYATRGEARDARTRLLDLTDEIIDADDRLAIAERDLLANLDAQAKRAIADTAKQVSLVTAVSPRAIIDVAFVVFAAARLLRRIARIYGGRPGTLGFLRLFRAALGHLAVTGGVAVGDSLLQQALGMGLAARVSAKLGEGVLNGLMTARFGLAAMAVCRPLPFIRQPAPRIGEVAGELLSRAEQAEKSS